MLTINRFLTCALLDGVTFLKSNGEREVVEVGTEKGEKYFDYYEGQPFFWVKDAHGRKRYKDEEDILEEMFADMCIVMDDVKYEEDAIEVFNRLLLTLV